MKSLPPLGALALLAVLAACAAPSGGSAPASDPRPVDVSQQAENRSRAAPARSRTVINRDEIEAERASNAYDLISRVRPQWLRARGTETTRTADVADPARPGMMTQMVDDTQIMVYVDVSRLDGIGDLRLVTLHNVDSIRFFTPAEATQRWGSGHSKGAILVTIAG